MLGHRLQRRLASLAQDREGVATAMLAGALFMLLGIATVSIDLGSIYLAKRKLQGVADAAAMAAAQEDSLQSRRSVAEHAISESRVESVVINTLESGTYTADKSIALDARFQSGGDASATRLELVQTVPLFFGKALGFPNATVRASATAARIDMAAYSLGTKLAAVSGGIPNKILSALIGTQLNLSVVDSQGLASANVDVLGFADALKLQVNAKDITYAELFDQDIAVADAIQALGKSLGNSGSDATVAALLKNIAGNADFVNIRLADIIDLGPYGRLDYYPGKTGVEVDAYSLLRTMLELSQGDYYDINFGLDVAGLASTNVRLVGGRGMAHSPWLTVTGARDYVLRTSQARLLITAAVNTGVPLLPSIKIPIYTELAEAEARLDDISCTGDEDSDGVTLAVTPAIGTLGIGEFSPGAMTDLATPITLSPATLVKVPLIAQVTGQAQIDLGGVTSQDVLFTLAEIKDHTTKTVSTHDLTQAVASSLIQQTTLQVKMLGLGLSTSSVTNIVGRTLAIAAPLLDTTIFSLTEAMGVKVGAADVRVDKVRCGVPSILA